MKIKELLSSPDKWTKKMLARNEQGKEVAVMSSDAACWCLLGALCKCYDRNAKGYDEAMRCIYAALALNDRTGDWSIGDFNDNSTYDEVVALVTELDI